MSQPIFRQPGRRSGRGAIATETTRWWEDSQKHSDSFFEAVFTLRAEATPAELADLWITLEMAYYAVESIPCPRPLKTARRTLLEAMANVLAGFAAALDGQLARSSRRVTRAQSNLVQFRALLREPARC